MNARPSDLFEAFREDHAVLGRDLHEISEHLRGGDLLRRRPRRALNREAGAHIAFEEQFFSDLRRLLGDQRLTGFTESTARAYASRRLRSCQKVRR